MRSRLLTGYIAAITVAALLALVFTHWGSLFALQTQSLAGLGVLVLMALLSEALAVRMDVGKGTGNTSNTSVTFIPMLASAQLFGPAAAVLCMLVSALISEFAIRRKALERATFNVAQLTLAAFVGGLAFHFAGGRALEPLRVAGLSPDYKGQLWPFVALGLVFMSLNHAAVSLAIALSQGLRFKEVWGQMLGRSGATFNDLMISPVAIGVAFLYMQFTWWGILVVFFPLLFIRAAYKTTSRLRDANRDLLTALVKAIETRDPYTSGHSLRVAYLAKRIAEVMGMPRDTIDRIRTAALLHDVGKIDAVYTGILLKPSDLTPQERSVIESHVTKGEELLRNLSSVPEDVLLTVRHHHEREDGAGYPDGLVGNEIPIGARIVSVCDAIDAMLSDRPYRKALPVSAVVEQLQIHSGTQFAPHVVTAVLSTDLVGEYAAVMRVSREEGLSMEGMFESLDNRPWVPRRGVPPSTVSPRKRRAQMGSYPN